MILYVLYLHRSFIRAHLQTYTIINVTRFLTFWSRRRFPSGWVRRQGEDYPKPQMAAPGGGTSQPEQGSEAGKLVLEYPQTMGDGVG